MILRSAEAVRDWLRLTNPRNEKPAVEAGPGGTMSPMKAPVPRRILVVEDNLDSVHSLVMLLRHMGHHVDYAINGYAAVSLAKAMRPDFIFLDLGLPGLNGFEVCVRLKTDPALARCRIIAITGYTHEEHERRSKQVGCELHLRKPVPIAVLEALLT